MVSAINGAVPGTNSDLVSASVRANFLTAQAEITALQAAVAALQAAGTGVPLTGGTIYNPSAAPNTSVLNIRAAPGNYARIGYTVDGVADQWFAGTGPAGHFSISDLAATPAYRLDIDPTGWARVNGSLTVGNGLGNTGAGSVNATAYYLNGAPFTGGGGGGGLALEGGTLRNPAGAPNTSVLTLSAIPGNYARIAYNIDGVATQWFSGVGPIGHFTISDLAATPAYRLDIDPTGWVHIAQGVTVGAALINMGAGTVNATAYYQNGTLFTGGGGGGLPETGGSLANPSAATVLTLDNAGGILLPQVNLRQANNTLALPTAVTSNVQLGQFQFQGYNGTAYGTGANIYAQVASGVTWTAGNMNSRLIFQTCRQNSGNLQIAFQVGALGGLVVGTASAGDQGPGTVNVTNLYVNGTTLEDYIKAVVGI